ncbi:F0F1 ATP synthase subunit epsilon [Methylomonas sp. MgM2]
MRLKVLLPTEILLDTAVSKVVAEAENGSFCLEPRHIDFVSALVPGLLSYVTLEGRELFVGIDEGILVKCGREVRVSTREAVLGENPKVLHSTILRRISELDEHERNARSVLARLEAGVAKQFSGLQKRG